MYVCICICMYIHCTYVPKRLFSEEGRHLTACIVIGAGCDCSSGKSVLERFECAHDGGGGGGALLLYARV